MAVQTTNLALEDMTAAFTIDIADEEATARLMADLGLLIGAGDVITLSGDLGAGKTAAARALIRYLADDAALEVPSPTFTLVQRYDLPAFAVLHADLYRLNDTADLGELDVLPPPDGTTILIEWAERAGDLLTPDRIDLAFVQIEGDASRRTVTISGFGHAAAIVERLQSLRAFLDRSGLLDAPRTRMPGDASIRSYARLAQGGKSLILMNSPKRPDGPPVHRGRSYSATVHLAEDVVPFVAIAGGLRERGFSTPEILHEDLGNGFLVTEDFGTAGILDESGRPIPERYGACVDVLAALHVLDLPEELPLAAERGYRVPDFDIDAMLVEVGLMPDWYLPDRGITVLPAMREEFDALWRELLEPAQFARKTWMIRDYHSPNVIWLDTRAGIKRVGIIDFQDAVIGPEAYDVVSLAQDARVDISEALEIELLAHYVKARRAASFDFDASTFAALYALMSAQRNTRLLGTFARLNRRDGKPHYLKHQPRAWAYLMRALAHPSLDSLRAWYARYLPAPAGVEA